MAITVQEFDPVVHQKVRYRDQLYAVLLQECDFFNLPGSAEVGIHFVSHEKVILTHRGTGYYNVKKKELVIVEPHIIE